MKTLKKKFFKAPTKNCLKPILGADHGPMRAIFEGPHGPIGAVKSVLASTDFTGQSSSYI